MNRTPPFLLALPLLLGAAWALPSTAAQTVNVTLGEAGAVTTMPTNDGMNMGGDAASAAMKVAATPTTVAHGPVTFQVTNDSRDFVHEMLVVPVTEAGTPLPYDPSAADLDETRLGSLGEVSELDPGKSGSLTLDLKPGRYALVCNQPGHYAAGMWTLLTVN